MLSSKEYKKQISKLVLAEIEKEKAVMTRKIIKIACVALINKFGFGKKRIQDFSEEFFKIVNDNVDNEIMWDKIDEVVIDKCGIPFEKEDYEECEEAIVYNRKHKNRGV